MSADNLPAAIAEVNAANQELADIRALQESDSRTYWNDAALQARELELMEESLTPETRTTRAVAAIRDGLDEEDWQALDSSFMGLSEAVHEAFAAELATEPVPAMMPASWDDLQRFRSTPEGETLANEWGNDAPFKLATLRERMRSFSRRLNDDDWKALSYWFDNLSSAEALAIERVLAG